MNGRRRSAGELTIEISVNPMRIKRLAGYFGIPQAFFNLMEWIQRVGYFQSDSGLLNFSISNFEFQL